MRILAALSALLLAANGSASPISPENRFSIVRHDGVSAEDVAPILARLHSEYAPLLQRFELDTIPVVTLQIWADEEAYQAAMEATLGQRAPGSRGYVTGPDEVRALLAGQPHAPREVFHEFIHAVTLNVNPNFGNNPRWLWEAAAIYLAGEENSADWMKRSAGGTCPPMELLNSPFDRGGTIYSVGYVLGDYVETRWGAQGLLDLIKANGETAEALGVSQEAFEAGWCAHFAAAIANAD